MDKATGTGHDEGAEPRIPALTRIEADLIDGYLKAVDDPGRLNPARADSTYGALRAAQALVAHAAAVRDAVTTMFERGETELYPTTLRRALLALDAPRRVGRLAVRPAPPADRS